MAVDADTGKSGIADAMMKWNKERHIKDVGEPSRAEARKAIPRQSRGKCRGKAEERQARQRQVEVRLRRSKEGG